MVHKGFDGNQGTGETQLIFVLNRDYGFLFEYLLERLVARLVFCWSSATLLRLKKRQFGVKIPARGIETFRRVELFSECQTVRPPDNSPPTTSPQYTDN